MINDLSVQELRDLYAILIGPWDYCSADAYQEAKDRMRRTLRADVESGAYEHMLITLSLRLEIVEALLAGQIGREKIGEGA